MYTPELVQFEMVILLLPLDKPDESYMLIPVVAYSIVVSVYIHHTAGFDTDSIPIYST